LVPGQYLSPGFRFLGANRIGELWGWEVTNPSMDIAKTWYIYPIAGPGGNGTERNPWQDFVDAVAEDASDSVRGKYKVYTKEGVVVGGPELRGKKIKEFDWRGSAGNKTIIRGYASLPAGFAFWTPIGGATPDVWEWAAQPQVTANAGVIDASVPQNMGRTGLRTADVFQLKRGVPNLSYAALQVVPKSYSFHVATRTMRINPGVGVDPNARDYWIPYTSGIKVTAGNSADFNVCKVWLEHIDFEGCYIGVNLERCYAEITGCDINYMLGNCIQLNESSARVNGGTMGGSMQDNVNSQGGILTPPPDKKLVSTFNGVDFWGNPSGAEGVGGDNVSNHQRHIYILENCKLEGSAKSGLGAQDDFILSNSVVRDSVTWGLVFVGAGPGSNYKGQVINTLFEGNDRGLAVLPVNDEMLTCDIRGSHFRNNIVSDIGVAAVGTGVYNVNVTDWKVSGLVTRSNGTIEGTGVTGTAPTLLGEL